MGVLAALVQWLHLQNRAAKLLVVASSDFVLLFICVFVAYALRISAIGFPKFEVRPIYIFRPRNKISSTASRILALSMFPFISASTCTEKSA